jgi:hypothetical protein
LIVADPTSTVINFQTRCNNNIAIDYTDPNYFASSSLDDPGMVVWDKRASSQSFASRMYNESFNQEDIPWGGVLKLKRVIEGTEKEVNIKQLRYSREERGALGVLSTAGQLRILQTKKEFMEPGSADNVPGSPEMLEIRKSYELEYPYSDPAHQKKQEQRIISFDWLNLGTSQLQARVVALRANGDFEILQMPPATAGQLSQLMPWQPPHRREYLGFVCGRTLIDNFIENENYMTLMNFADPSEREKVLGPLFATAAKANVPIFGPNKFASASIKTILNAAIKRSLHSEADPIVDLLASTDPALELFKEELTQSQISSKMSKGKMVDSKISPIEPDSSGKVCSSVELYDRSHYSVFRDSSKSNLGSELPSHVMLNRAEDGYLFDCKKNQLIVTNDHWLQDVWEWIEGKPSVIDLLNTNSSYFQAPKRLQMVMEWSHYLLT